MTNYAQEFQNRSAFTEKKVQDLFEVVNQALRALNICSQDGKHPIYKEDLQMILVSLSNAYTTIGEFGNIITGYQNNLPSRNVRFQIQNQIHTIVSQSLPYSNGYNMVPNTGQTGQNSINGNAPMMIDTKRNDKTKSRKKKRMDSANNSDTGSESGSNN